MQKYLIGYNIWNITCLCNSVSKGNTPVVFLLDSRASCNTIFHIQAIKQKQTLPRNIHANNKQSTGKCSLIDKLLKQTLPDYVYVK